MTLLVTILLAGGQLLMLSGFEGVSLGETFRGLLTNTTPQPASGASALPGGPLGNSATLSAADLAEQASGQAVFIPGYGATASEWPVGDWFNGVIAACVETASRIAANITTGLPATQGAIAQDVTDLQARGQAGKGGSTTLQPELQLLADKYGVQSTYYQLPDANTQSIIQSALQRGQPVIFGLGNASVLTDQLTGKKFDANVHGHAITLEGYDAQGVWAAEPNSPDPGYMVKYTWSDLFTAQGGDMAVVGS